MECKKTVAVVIDYNTYERTYRYVNSLIESSNIHIECITIVDNSCSKENIDSLKNIFHATIINDISIDGIVSVFRTMIDDTIVIIAQSEKNLGFSMGNNIGELISREICEYDYIVFSNNDIVFEKTFDLRALIDSFEDSRVGLVGPSVYGVDGNKQSPCREQSFWEACLSHYFLWPINKLWEKNVPEIIETNQKEFVYRIIGAFMIFSIKSFQIIDGFDENTFMYAEEQIVSERLIKKKYKILYNPATSIVHEGGITIDSYNNWEKFKFQSNEMFKSKCYYYTNYKGISKMLIGISSIIYGIYMKKKEISFMLIGK